MNTSKSLFHRLTACQNLFLAIVAMFISACSTLPNSDSTKFTSDSTLPEKLRPGIVVVGAVAKTGLKAPIDTLRMSTDLAALLAGSGNLSITPATVVRDIIGAGPHDEIMSVYARNGRMAPYQIQRLMAADLSGSRALSVRLESDRVERLPVVKQQVMDEAGVLVADRERRVFSTRRTTRLSATLLDLQNGRIVWTRVYQVSPETVKAADHHTGGSFGASLAAAMADTMMHGPEQRQHPAPPELSASVLALLQEVAYNVPTE